MRRFVWRLQRVLEIKSKEEQLRTQELLKLTEKLAEKRGELLGQQRIVQEMIAKIAAENPDNRLAKQEFFLRYCSTTDEYVEKLKGELGELESRQREKISEVLKLRRFREGLERLREEAKRRFIEEQERIEQKQLDETATIGFSRKVKKN